MKKIKNNKNCPVSAKVASEVNAAQRLYANGVMEQSPGLSRSGYPGYHRNNHRLPQGGCGDACLADGLPPHEKSRVTNMKYSHPDSQNKERERQTSKVPKDFRIRG